MTSPFFSVLPGHDLAYTEIVKPTRRWAFSYYFLYRWLPLLHPQQAMLIQVLRQSTWQQGRPTGRCQLANATLCRLLGWAESSHKTLLAELERPLSGWFIQRERTRKRHVTEGHAVEGAPRYRVTMDDPLTPRDQAALEGLLRTIHPATPYEAAEFLASLAEQRSRELWSQLDEQSVPATLPATPASVADIARLAWPHLGPSLVEQRAFAESAERCQLRLTGAGYAHMELDYLLRGWLPHLGINNTWLTIILRARCFYDPTTGETRDSVTVSRRELEAQLGIPERSFRRLLRDEQTLPLFHISPADAPAAPANPRTLPHRGDLTFHLAYPLLPICPEDQPRYEGLLLGGKADFSTTGQATRLEADNQPGCSGEEIHNRTGNPARSGQATRLKGSQPDRQPGSKRTTNPAEEQPTGQATRLEADNQPTIQKALQSKELTSEKQKNPPMTFGGRGSKTEMTVIERLLAPFQIKGLARLLQNPSLTAAEVRGWIYRGHEEVDVSQMSGYLFRRLSTESAEREHLPALYRLAGEVDEAESELFEEWWVEEFAPPPFEDKAQRERYAAWLTVVKRESGNPDRPDHSPRASWRREMARARAL